MKTKLESFTKIINHERIEGQSYGTFHMEDNPQYVDVNKLTQYTKSELMMIGREYGKWFSGAGWTKPKMISSILNDINIVNKIKSINREIILSDLLG
jgi:hypothetical protein